MSHKAFVTKTGDTTPISVNCRDKFGFVDLTDATVVFNMKTPAGVVKVARGACNVLSPTVGYVQYAFELVDVDTVGNYRGEFEVTFDSGKITTFPSGDYIPIKILVDLG